MSLARSSAIGASPRFVRRFFHSWSWQATCLNSEHGGNHE
jgi:hypothetical protein